MPGTTLHVEEHKEEWIYEEFTVGEANWSASHHCARRAAGQLPRALGVREVHQPGSVGGLIESRWAVLELSFERREGEGGEGEEAFWAGNNLQMKTRRHGVIMA